MHACIYAQQSNAEYRTIFKQIVQVTVCCRVPVLSNDRNTVPRILQISEDPRFKSGPEYRLSWVNHRFFYFSPGQFVYYVTSAQPLDATHMSVIVMAYKGPEVHLHDFLTSKLDAYECSDSRPGRVHLEANLQYPLSGTLGGPRVG